MTASNLHRAGELIASFKKVAVDQSNEARRRFELSAYVRDVLTSLGPLYKRSRHTVRLEAEGKLEVYTHAGAVSQIVTNLLSNAIDEAEAFIEEFDDEEAEDVVRELKRRNLDPLRVRFLWGWYQGEIDDLVLFQQRRGTAEVERDWALYLVDDSFYAELAKDLS